MKEGNLKTEMTGSHAQTGEMGRGRASRPHGAAVRV